MGAHLAELPARWWTSRRCVSSPRRPTTKAHGWELPADGAHRAASSSNPMSRSETSCTRSNVVGLHRLASSGCSPGDPACSCTSPAWHGPVRADGVRRLPAVSLRLYDTAARAVRDFTPLRAGQASVYVCGLTVQGPPHVGHVRSALAFDVLRRWLTHRGLEVTYVRNVTDIDDKILAKAAAAGVPWWAWAYTNELAVTRAYDVLGVLPPTYEPRATGHVTDMVALMERLMERGHAYAVDGDVYFDVRSFPGYGALTGQKLDDLQPAADTDSDERKRDPRDFALWKAHKPGEPDTASWPTPWGRGRPGWHLECSAMAEKYLGSEFGLHGGGLDLRFPHHENERAQSQAAGHGFARYWLHNAWVTLGGEKMSKSLGNTLLVDEVVQRVRPVELRYYLVAPHYRSMIEFTESALEEAAVAYRRGGGLVRAPADPAGADARQPAPPRGVSAALDDPPGTPP